MMEPADKPHILIVDDDERLCALIGRFLKESGYAVSMAHDAAAARRQMALFRFDLMVLDVMMPGESGLEFAASLPKDARLPILMLSARSEIEDRVAGLEVGVDDYLTKPFEPKELLLRIRAILRRVVQVKQAEQSIVFGDYVFDLQTSNLRRGEAPIPLTSAEATLLKALAENAGEPVTREQLAQSLGQDSGNERSIDVQVTRLRKKIEPLDGRPQYVQTVRGSGYVLNARKAS